MESLIQRFGGHLQRFLVVSTGLANELEDKEELTKAEQEFLSVFEDIAEIIMSAEFQSKGLNRK